MNFFKKIFRKNSLTPDVTFNENELTPPEQQICDELRFSYQDALLLKRLTGSSIEKFIFEYTQSEIDPPVYISATFRKSEPDLRAILEQQDILAPNGKFLFLNSLLSPEKLVFANDTNDPYKIMKYAETDGINHGFDNSTVIAKIKEWDSKYGIRFAGIGYDFLLLKVLNTSKIDFNSFAEEILEFCPDLEDTSQIIDDLENSAIQLWWD